MTAPRKKPVHKTKKPALTRHYFEILLEDINSKLQQLAESFTTVATKEDFRQLDHKVEHVISEQQVMKRILKDHSATLNEHSAMLKELSTQKTDKKDLEPVVAKTNQIDAKVDQLASQAATQEDVREIKTILANHEQRLANLHRFDSFCSFSTPGFSNLPIKVMFSEVIFQNV